MLFRLLKKRDEGENLRTLAEEFSISKRTAYRDLSALAEIGFELRSVDTGTGEKRVMIFIPPNLIG